MLKILYFFSLILLSSCFSYNFSSLFNYLIVPLDHLGLANRLRIISSSFILSQKQQRKLLILWKPSKECNSTFSSLFLSSITFDILEIDLRMSFEREELISYFTKLSISLSERFEVIIKFPNQFFIDISQSVDSSSLQRKNILVLRSLISHAPSGMNCIEYMQMKSFFYHQLQPINRLQQRINNFIQTYFPQNINNSHLESRNNSLNSHERSSKVINVVGIHYRVYDQRYDWPILPPSSMTNFSNNLTLSFDQSTPLEVILQSILQLYQKNSKIKFFLASNNLQSKKIILEMLKTHLRNPPEIFISSKKLFIEGFDNNFISRSLQSSIEDAVVDFYILGTISDLILHTKGSSFGQEAAYLSRKHYNENHYFPTPIIDLTSKNLLNQLKGRIEPLYIYTYSSELDWCGLSEYYNSMMKINNGFRLNGLKEKKECFYEMTGEEYDQQIVDGLSNSDRNSLQLKRNGRVVCTYSQKLSRCENIETISGLNPIYCLKNSNISNSSKKNVNSSEEGEIEEDFINIYSELTGL